MGIEYNEADEAFHDNDVPKNTEAVWIKSEDGNLGHFYSIDTRYDKREHHVVGDGSKKPSPNALKDFLDKKPLADISYGANLMSTTIESSRHVLPNGVYVFRDLPYSLPDRLVPLVLRDDEFLQIHQMSEEVKAYVKNFLENEAVYRKLKTLYKQAMLFYGPPGNGKTSEIRNLSKECFPKDTVIIFLKSVPSVEFLDALKASLSKRLKVFILEEITNMVKEEQTEALLNFLDGEQSPDKSLFILTTNYPELLPGNIVGRRSRIDKLIKFDSPNDEKRHKIIKAFLEREATEEEILATKNFSIADLKEVCLTVLKTGCTLQKAIKDEKKQADLVKKNFAEYERMGM